MTGSAGEVSGSGDVNLPTEMLDLRITLRPAVPNPCPTLPCALPARPIIRDACPNWLVWHRFASERSLAQRHTRKAATIAAQASSSAEAV